LYVTFSKAQLPILLHFHSRIAIVCGSVPHSSPLKVAGTANCDNMKFSYYV